MGIPVKWISTQVCTESQKRNTYIKCSVFTARDTEWDEYVSIEKVKPESSVVSCGDAFSLVSWWLSNNGFAFVISEFPVSFSLYPHVAGKDFSSVPFIHRVIHYNFIFVHFAQFIFFIQLKDICTFCWCGGQCIDVTHKLNSLTIPMNTCFYCRRKISL